MSSDEDFGEIFVDEVDDFEVFVGLFFFSLFYCLKINVILCLFFGDAFWRRRYNWSIFVVFFDLVVKEDVIEVLFCLVMKEYSIVLFDLYMCVFMVICDEIFKCV